MKRFWTQTYNATYNTFYENSEYTDIWEYNIMQRDWQINTDTYTEYTRNLKRMHTYMRNTIIKQGIWEYSKTIYTHYNSLDHKTEYMRNSKKPKKTHIMSHGFFTLDWKAPWWWSCSLSFFLFFVFFGNKFQINCCDALIQEKRMTQKQKRRKTKKKKKKKKNEEVTHPRDTPSLPLNHFPKCWVCNVFIV